MTLLPALLLCPVLSVMADSITLKDGKVLKGDVINDGPDGVLIEYFVTATIKDQKLVAKDEIATISVIPPDEKAFQDLGILATPKTVLDTSFHDQLIEKKIPEYLKQYPYSRHLTELREDLRSLEAERARLRQGDRRIDGTWIEAAKIEEDPYQFGAKIQFAEMKDQMQARDLVGALKSYELLEKKYPASDVIPDAVDAALKSIDLLQGKIGLAKANFEIFEKRRQKTLANARADQAKELRDAMDKDAALAEKAMATASADGSKFFPVFQNNREALVALQELVTAEKNRLTKLQISMHDSVVASRDAAQLLSSGSLKEARDQLASAEKLWPSNPEVVTIKSRLAEISEEENKMREEENKKREEVKARKELEEVDAFKKLVEVIAAPAAGSPDQILKAKATLRKNTKTIREVETDQRYYRGTKFCLNGKIEVSSYYNYGYTKAQGTHYSFKLTDDDGKTANLYMQRENAASLRQQLLDAGGSLKGIFIVVIDTGRFEDTANLYLEVLGYMPPIE